MLINLRERSDAVAGREERGAERTCRTEERNMLAVGDFTELQGVLLVKRVRRGSMVQVE